MTSKIVHFDTINGENQIDEVYSTRSGTSGQSCNLGHSYFTRIPLVNPLYGVSNIELSSIEFLNSIYNVRVENGSNKIEFNFMYQGVMRAVGIALIPKNYTTIADLLVDINSALLSQILQQTVLSGFSIILSVNSKDSGKIIVKGNCDTYVADGILYGTMIVGDSILSKHILGITFGNSMAFADCFIGNTTTGFSTLTSTNNYNLQCDNYINLNFSNINHSGAANADAKIVTFKLPMSSNYNEVIYYTSGQNFPQCLMLESNKTVTHLMLKVTDRFGFPIYGTSSFSFSLTFYF